MFSVIVLVVVLTNKMKTHAEENLYYNNGWRPVSSEKVLRNLHQTNIKTPDANHATAFHWNPILLAGKNIERITQNAIVTPHDINTELMTKDYNDYVTNNEKVIQASMSEKQLLEYLIKDKTKTIHTYAEHRRKGKNIIENEENVDMNILHDMGNKKDVMENNVQDDLKNMETIIIDDKYNNYEVTEASETSQIKDSLDIDHGRIYKQKTYFEPISEVTKNNLSSILLNILGNYNIRSNDDLTNYALSRKKHHSNDNKQNYMYSAPIRTPPMWNSQNYFPLDPFLAVFLSNYGYYLPGLYGFPGNYYNIYGYLASNNIHNNKPFGAYKIYSDTDSSH